MAALRPEESRYYDTITEERLVRCTSPTARRSNGLPYDRAGSDIDTTNPEAAQWYWDMIRDNIISKGFDSLWADETEPDLPPNGGYFYVGAGDRSTSIFIRLLHTAALYDGFPPGREAPRADSFARRLPGVAEATEPWSGRLIFIPTWDAYRRQIPTGLNFTASGMAYWTNDIGGWQYLPGEHHPHTRRCSILPTRAKRRRV